MIEDSLERNTLIKAKLVKETRKLTYQLFYSPDVRAD